MSTTRSLRDVQVWMVGAITGKDADANAKDVEKYVTASARLSAAGRFDVYRSGYHARLYECLLDDYPVLAAILSRLDSGEDDQFAALCRAYVDRHPSASPNLNGFGRHMPAFCREVKLERFPGFDALRVFASELAALEWALVEVLHAETAPPLEIAALQALPPEAWAGARFIKSEGLRVFRFEYPVNAVFIANRIDEIVPEVPAPSPNAIAVYRKDMLLWRMELTPAMLGVLEPLLAGKSLGEALATIEAEVTDPEVLAQTGANLMVWFREWVDAGFFTRIELADAKA
ncbi:MAG: hypothetical protein JWP87_841 [Labilithrix sp.]|nr:hypothetical protein [Labilithrix sp.]